MSIYVCIATFIEFKDTLTNTHTEAHKKSHLL